MFLLFLANYLDWSRIMYRMVGHKVMDIMAAFPPTYRQSAAKVGNEDTNHSISHEVMRNASVACIMRREHDLML